MKKTFALKTIFLMSVGYLGFQFLVLPAYLERQITFNLFQNLYTSLRIPLFILDIPALNSSLPPHQIVEGLSRQNIIHYGLIKDVGFTSTLDKYRLHFETIGLKFYTTRSFNREIKSLVTSHYFLCSPDLTVHVVVFYNKTKSTLWHGGVHWRKELNDSCVADKENFFKHAGLYDRFGIVKKGNLLFPENVAQFLDAAKNSLFLECNYTRAQQFFAQHPPDNAEESLKFQRKARQIIARAKQYLDDLGIPFWLSSGTCLGWFRQCDIIPYSHDVDFGIWIKDYKPELVTAFERGGFFLKHVFGKVNDSYELSFQAGDIKLDLFFFYEEVDYMWNGGTHHETGQKYKYIFPKFTMCWTIFLELKVRVPCPPRPYIEANYGKNWSEPVKDWEWNKSPPNVRENGVWPKEEWNEVIQVY
ncbi:ribitol-5-phosphate transferase FKTN-like isoform X2 [Mercenaria mercenaria]|uniref:ribitol-5-phosphate transferase FKTN-like isoform X2 n=1 Tax=Mercenaria mercenaria TaxID=6596 RepID=UPI00234E8A18|nr:ribitol-5-phosphate transferase FKTN-like isoform X2 [Mercenaria mercenaria]